MSWPWPRTWHDGSGAKLSEQRSVRYILIGIRVIHIYHRVKMQMGEKRDGKSKPEDTVI